MQLVDYLNGMWYMICLPSLLCGLAVSVEDVRARRVPRAWIAVGCMAQIIVNIIYALSVNALFLALQSLLFAVLAAVLQCALALIRPGALGFGDVTVTSVMGLGVGMFGLYAMVLWWLFIAVIGLLWIASGPVSTRRGIRNMPAERRSPRQSWWPGRSVSRSALCCST